MADRMIATVDVADLGARRTLGSLRHRPTPDIVPGLRWLNVGIGAPLASVRPPALRRAVMIGLWDDEATAATFNATDPLAQRFAADGFHAVLQPLRAFGTWPGLPAEVPRTRVTDHDGPVLVTTLGRLRMSQALRFLRASRPAERSAIAANGFVWGTAAVRPPFLATVSLWRSAEAAASYAYGDPQAGHPQAITKQRRKDFHHQSAFIRFAPISVTGSLSDMPALDLPRNAAS
ncbi:MAG: spheroidene monooxygenase [Acidimicrobiales bacterium]